MRLRLNGLGAFLNDDQRVAVKKNGRQRRCPRPSRRPCGRPEILLLPIVQAVFLT